MLENFFRMMTINDNVIISKEMKKSFYEYFMEWSKEYATVHLDYEQD